MVRGLRHALLVYRKRDWRALYDLEKDPGQRHNIIDDEPERAAELIEIFRAFGEIQRRPVTDFLDPSASVPPLPPCREVKITPQTERQLKALGYLK